MYHLGERVCRSFLPSAGGGALEGGGVGQNCIEEPLLNFLESFLTGAEGAETNFLPSSPRPC